MHVNKTNNYSSTAKKHNEPWMKYFVFLIITMMNYGKHSFEFCSTFGMSNVAKFDIIYL